MSGLVLPLTERLFVLNIQSSRGQCLPSYLRQRNSWGHPLASLAGWRAVARAHFSGNKILRCPQGPAPTCDRLQQKKQSRVPVVYVRMRWYYR